MKRILTAVCCMSMMSIPALAQSKTEAKAPMTDQQFVDFAAQTDMVEANLGQEAQDVAAKQEVKDYGQMLVTDHTRDYQHLCEVADQAHVTVPKAIDAAQNKEMIGPFSKLKGAAFDHRYIPDMVAGHTKAVAIYKKEAEDADSPAIRDYAQEAIPVLEKHLNDAKAIAAGKKPDIVP